jgi:hypothetical protein
MFMLRSWLLYLDSITTALMSPFASNHVTWIVFKTRMAETTRLKQGCATTVLKEFTKLVHSTKRKSTIIHPPPTYFWQKMYCTILHRMVHSELPATTWRYRLIFFSPLLWHMLMLVAGSVRTILFLHLHRLVGLSLSWFVVFSMFIVPCTLYSGVLLNRWTERTAIIFPIARVDYVCHRRWIGQSHTSYFIPCSC